MPTRRFPTPRHSRTCLPGSYTVQEISIPAGWSLTNIVVTGAVSSVVTIGTDSDFDVGDSLVTVALVNGENVTITYTDTKLGSLTVVKDAVPNDAQDFTFDPSNNLQAANILLDDDADATLSNTKAFPNLLPGSYTVQEISIPAGWSLTNIVVTGAVNSVVTIGTDSDFDVGDSLVTVALVNGENVTITYTDTKLGSLTVVKDAVPNDAAGLHVRPQQQPPIDQHLVGRRRRRDTFQYQGLLESPCRAATRFRKSTFRRAGRLPTSW